MRLIFFHSGDLKSHIMIKFVPAQEEVKTMKTVVIEGKDLLFTLFKLAFYIWIGMWNVRILLVAVKMVIAVGVYSTYFAVILVSVYGIYSAFRGLKKTVAKTIRRWLFEGDSAAQLP